MLGLKVPDDAGVQRTGGCREAKFVKSYDPKLDLALSDKLADLRSNRRSVRGAEQVRLKLKRKLALNAKRVLEKADDTEEELEN